MAAGFKGILALLFGWKSAPSSAVAGPYRVAAGQVWHAGAEAGGYYFTGEAAGQTFLTGQQAGQIHG